ncbi:ceramide synthase 2 isoform X3 [Silurus meridionalis]|uniref:ceramide synthase 2 isoform X3 n=1 Tax=Silurus meridionalis TaxID=175797 RepID=UPI001EEC2932|nr:ceramide synthase 2 isoform X3 [Silurus meridionalis]
MELIDEWLWRQEYWLPPGITWRDLEKMEGSPFPRDLLISLPLALSFIGLRKIFERSFAVPLSRLLGVKDRVRFSASAAPSLEAFYTKHSRQPAPNELSSLVKQSGLTQKQVEIWFHHRRNQDRPSNTKKFCEASWRFVFYLISFTGGLASLISTPWFWEQKECWRGYPQQRVENVHYWYYMLELGFYWSLLLCVSVDVKRKDFKEQIVHHIATIFLLGFSYCANYIRIGTLVMLVHDSSDFLLELDKDERSDDESEAEEEEDVDEEEDHASWRKRKVVLDSKLAMMTSSCVLNNLANQRVNASSRTPKAR